ncbi:MAG: IS21 family transposase [Planctomycetota bacterium]|jgi:transposase
MDQVHVIRHKVRVEKLSVRQVAKDLGISRNTVRRYLRDETPIGERRAAARPTPVRDAVADRVHAMLVGSGGWTAGKQRLTATRLHQMLRGEGFDVGATLIKELVHEWRRQRQEVFVPLTYRPGELAEVDFFEVVVEVGGERRKAFLFVMRLMFSGRDFGWLYDRQDQVCFLDGLVRAFHHLGFVPRRIAFDNLKPAVRRLLRGSMRELAQRFAALVTHYLFEPCFARPRTGHDKGGVEARGKGIRHQELVPIPVGASLDEISTALLARLDGRVVDGDRAERFATEQMHGLPLPSVRFDARATHLVVATRQSIVRVEGAVYSVPCKWAGLDATAYVGPVHVTIIGRCGAEVRHPRMRFGQRSIDYRHYLAELAKKPQALRQVAPELMRDLGRPFTTAWASLSEQKGSLEAARAFAKVLQVVVEVGIEETAKRLASALATQEPILLALRAKADPPASVAADTIPASLRDVDVEGPSLRDFDLALGGVA